MLVHLAGPDNVDLVMVGGHVLVEGGRLTMVDERQLLAEVTASSDSVWAGYGRYNPKGRDVAEAFPPSYPAFGSRP